MKKLLNERIVDVLDGGKRLTVRSISELTGATTGSVSSTLCLLMEEGIVRVARWNKSNGHWVAAYELGHLPNATHPIAPPYERKQTVDLTPDPIPRPELWEIEKAFLYLEKSCTT